MEPSPPFSFYFVRKANGQAVVVSILRKFIFQESLKIVTTMSQNNLDNDSKQENQHPPTLFPL